MYEEMQEFPTLTIAIPTYNENSHIENILQGFLRQGYPNLLEIIVADGGSFDGTQDTVETFAQKECKVKLIHNPDKFQAFGLNAMIKEARGEFFLRADAHSVYAPDYIEKCVEALQRTQAVNVGGAQRFVAKSSFQLGLCLASKSILGTGGAKYRDPNYDGYSDTVYLGCFKKEALLKVGGFDTNQTTNQDAELNQRLTAAYNNAIYVSSQIHVGYYPRSTWKQLWVQYFRYGRGRYLTGTKHQRDKQLRGKLPFISISLLISICLICAFVPVLRPFGIFLLFFCLSIPFLESIRVFFKHRENIKAEIWRGENQKIPSPFLACYYCGVSLITMPLAHFSGYAYQMLRRSFFQVKDW